MQYNIRTSKRNYKALKKLLNNKPDLTMNTALTQVLREAGLLEDDQQDDTQHKFEV